MFKTVKGLILRRRRFGEAHAYITALTEEGLLFFGAYGVMSPKNKNFASCQPYTLAELVLTEKGESLTLSQASTVSHLIKQGVDFECLALANYISSLASETSFAVEDAPAIYSLTCTALSLIGTGSVDAEIIKAVFELRLTSALGFYPELDECIVCGKRADGGTFISHEGGIVCKKCLLPEGVQGIELSPELISALKKLVVLPDRQAFGIRFSDEGVKHSFLALTERFSAEHLDCAATALNYYKQNIKNF